VRRHDFCPCGFTAESKANLEVKMTKSVRKSQWSGLGDVKIIKVEGKTNKEKEVMVRHGIVPPKLKTWNYEHFSREWSRTYLTPKRKKNLK
jgi:hypothetical protein